METRHEGVVNFAGKTTILFSKVTLCMGDKVDIHLPRG
jgi:hypothetical protein